MIFSKSSRRRFIKKALGTALATSVIPSLLTAGKRNQVVELKPGLPEKKTFAANDQVNIAVIGMGIMGFNNLGTSVQVRA